ncbi:MAG TPA: hypothetical protein DDY49_13935 [Paenibacillaceae bacterium]|nr:hypothetical protein [Paenibacillaceae bacterium]
MKIKTLLKALLLIGIILLFATVNPLTIKDYVAEYISEYFPSISAPSAKPYTIEGINLGDSGELIKGKFGEPQKIYAGIEETTWWIYEKLWIGLRNNEVVEIFYNQEKVNYGGITTGMTRAEVEKMLEFNPNPKWIIYKASITFTNDLDKKVLYKRGKHALIAYYDTLDNNRLLGLRIIKPEELVVKNFFGYQYRSLYTPKFPEYKTDMAKVNRDQGEEILLLSNIERNKKGVGPLRWSDLASRSALKHSKDMSDHNYFSHSFSDGRTPFDLMKEQGITFRVASENIAMGYRDAIEAVYGWMNSSGHRHSLLNPDLKRLGAGVYNYYYTQHFYTPG